MNYQRWKTHFHLNALNREEPEWEAPMTLDGGPLRKLTRSLQQFQLGDGGGPAYLIAWNRETFLGQSPELRGLVELWFKEEEEHSRLLGDALKRFGGHQIDRHWSFTVFCAVRRWLGVQFELNALLLTEVVSQVYYQMLLRHGNDVALRQMCRLIIRDETSHIRFHEDRLRADSERIYGRLWEVVFRLRGLAAGTMLWVNHRAAVVALGGSTPEFYGSIWQGMSQFIERVRSGAARANALAGRPASKPSTLHHQAGEVT